MRYLTFFIFLLCGCRVFAQGFDTVFVHFDIGKYHLNDTARKELGLLSSQLQNTPERKILIYGYADYLGKVSPNQTLSQDRADIVAAYLLKNNIRAKQILVQEGLGQQDEKGTMSEKGNFQNRKVMILISRRRANAKPEAEKVTEDIGLPLEQPTVNAYKYMSSVEAPDTVIQHHIEVLLQQIDATPVQATFVLKDINFVRHEDYIEENSLPIVRSLVLIMQEFKDLRISIEGHICCNALDGIDPSTNAYKLSIRRAKRIYSILVSNGIHPRRLRYQGFGRTQPLFHDEKTEAEMLANRRVEIRILEK